MNKNEARCQVIFSHYARRINQSAAYELKYAGDKPLRKSDVKEHQVDFLLSTKHGTAYHKISDAGAVSALPVDCFTLHKANAYVVIFYPTLFTMIDIDTFQRITFSDITEEYAKDVADTVVFYTNM